MLLYNMKPGHENEIVIEYIPLLEKKLMGGWIGDLNRMSLCDICWFATLKWFIDRGDVKIELFEGKEDLCVWWDTMSGNSDWVVAKLD